MRVARLSWVIVGDPVVDHGRLRREQVRAEPFEFGEGDHPVPIRCSVYRHHLRDLGQLASVVPQLANLRVVLGEDDPAARVRDDERDVLGGRGRIHGRRSRSGAHDGQISQHPLVAGGRRHRDGLFALYAQRDQAGGLPADPVTDLAPGDARPAVAGRKAVGLAGRRGRNSIEEQPGDRRHPILDHGQIDLFRAGDTRCHALDARTHRRPVGGRVGPVLPPGTARTR